MLRLFSSQYQLMRLRKTIHIHQYEHLCCLFGCFCRELVIETITISRLEFLYQLELSNFTDDTK